MLEPDVVQPSIRSVSAHSFILSELIKRADFAQCVECAEELIKPFFFWHTIEKEEHEE